MKGKDIAIIGAVLVGGYMLAKQLKPSDASGSQGGVTLIDGGSQTPFDLGGLTELITGLVGGVGDVAKGAGGGGIVDIPDWTELSIPRPDWLDLALNLKPPAWLDELKVPSGGDILSFDLLDKAEDLLPNWSVLTDKGRKELGSGGTWQGNVFDWDVDVDVDIDILDWVFNQLGIGAGDTVDKGGSGFKWFGIDWANIGKESDSVPEVALATIERSDRVTSYPTHNTVRSSYDYGDYEPTAKRLARGVTELH